jgi:hypothetical protein
MREKILLVALGLFLAAAILAFSTAEWDTFSAKIWGSVTNSSSTENEA